MKNEQEILNEIDLLEGERLPFDDLKIVKQVIVLSLSWVLGDSRVSPYARLRFACEHELKARIVKEALSRNRDN